MQIEIPKALCGDCGKCSYNPERDFAVVLVTEKRNVKTEFGPLNTPIQGIWFICEKCDGMRTMGTHEFEERFGITKMAYVREINSTDMHDTQRSEFPWKG